MKMEPISISFVSMGVSSFSSDSVPAYIKTMSRYLWNSVYVLFGSDFLSQFTLFPFTEILYPSCHLEYWALKPLVKLNLISSYFC